MNIILLAVSVLTCMAGVIHLMAGNTGTAGLLLVISVIIYIAGKIDSRWRG